MRQLGEEYWRQGKIGSCDEGCPARNEKHEIGRIAAIREPTDILSYVSYFQFFFEV